MRSLRLVVALFAAVSCASADAQRAEPRLVITHFDVGQADATLIATPEGKHILIDAGNAGDRIAARLRQMGIRAIDLLISSHGHADHIGGIADVFDALEVRAYMDNGIPHTTSTYQRALLMASREPGLRYLQATDTAFMVGSAEVRVLPPAMVDQSQNNNSVGVIIALGRFTALYTGDSEFRQLQRWVDAGRIRKVTLLKAAHHGAWNGATRDYIVAASPSVVIVSVGAGNSYGHPSETILNAWAATGAKVYRTDWNGTIRFTADSLGSFEVQSRVPRP
jgi:competence protein ComEC